MNKSTGKAATTRTRKQIEQIGNIGTWLRDGWNVLMSDFWSFIAFTTLALLIFTAASLTIIGAVFVLGPLMASLFYVALQRLKGNSFSMGDLGQGFRVFGASFLAGVVISAFALAAAVFSILLVITIVGMGIASFMIPMYVVLALYMFTFPVIVERDVDFWTAMEASRKAVSKHWIELTVFVFIQGIILGIGLYTCLIGILVAIPLIFTSTACAYRDIVGLEK